jgi:uncharacterized protein (DUF486 family)
MTPTALSVVLLVPPNIFMTFVWYDLVFRS